MEKCYELSNDRAVKDEIIRLKKEIIEENRKCKKAFSFMINGEKKKEGDSEGKEEEKIREAKQTTEFEANKQE